MSVLRGTLVLLVTLGGEILIGGDSLSIPMTSDIKLNVTLSCPLRWAQINLAPIHILKASIGEYHGSVMAYPFCPPTAHARCAHRQFVKQEIASSHQAAEKLHFEPHSGSIDAFVILKLPACL